MHPFLRLGLLSWVLPVMCLSHLLLRPGPMPGREQEEPGASLIIHFKAMVNGQPLEAGKNYFNAFGEPFSVTRFKFYIGQIRLESPDNHRLIQVNKGSYFLIDLTSQPASSIAVSVLPGRYGQIHFLLGVDSIHNVSGAQTGALDPTRGMFWTWNSGYVMAKLEGVSNLSNQPGHAITYHIGGYRKPNGVQREINLDFPAGMVLETKNGKTGEINITANIGAWFQGPYPVHIREIPTCTTPGELAKHISENYAHMFAVEDLNQ